MCGGLSGPPRFRVGVAKTRAVRRNHGWVPPDGNHGRILAIRALLPINLTGLTGFTGFHIYNNMIYCVNPVRPVQKKDIEIELIGGEQSGLKSFTFWRITSLYPPFYASCLTV